MKVENFRDIMALLVGVVVFPAIWILQGLGWLQLAGEVMGATIAIETLIAQFYFRRAQANEGQ